MICFWFSDTEWSKSIFTWKEYAKNWKSERMASIIDDIMHILCIWLASLEDSKTRNELWTHLKLYFPIKSSRTSLERCNSKIFIAICVEKCGFSLVDVLDSMLSVVLRFAASDYSFGILNLFLSLSIKHLYVNCTYCW